MNSNSRILILAAVVTAIVTAAAYAFLTESKQTKAHRAAVSEVVEAM